MILSLNHGFFLNHGFISLRAFRLWFYLWTMVLTLIHGFIFEPWFYLLNHGFIFKPWFYLVAGLEEGRVRPLHCDILPATRPVKDEPVEGPDRGPGNDHAGMC